MFEKNKKINKYLIFFYFKNIFQIILNKNINMFFNINFFLFKN